MTPKELRQKAWSNIESAASLFETGKFDDASYLVGYAAEYLLKARYCTRKGWTDFPGNRTEAKNRGAPDKLLSHDLDKLLTLSEDIAIKTTSMHNIDWVLVSDWTSEQRYKPLGATSEQKAAAQITEIQHLYDELALYEILEKIRPIEIKLSEEKGPFDLFAIGYGFVRGIGWELLISAWWMSKNPTASIELIKEKISAEIDDDLLEVLSDIVYQDPRSNWVQRFHIMLRCMHQQVKTRHNSVNGVEMPPAFVVTSWPNERQPET